MLTATWGYRTCCLITNTWELSSGRAVQERERATLLMHAGGGTNGDAFSEMLPVSPFYTAGGPPHQLS